MILTKGKGNFWSQLLLSVIAIFALPQSQGLPNQINVQSETQQNVSTIQQKFVVQKALHPQIISFNLELSQQTQHEQHSAITPHFYVLVAFNQPPIRAGPLA